jgi:cysteine synthase
MSVIDHFEKVTDKDGAIYARKLAKEEGFSVDILQEVQLLHWFR